MANPTIKIKRSAVAGKIPTGDQLPLGEVALNTYDGRLFASKNVGLGTTVFAVNPWVTGVGTNTYNTYFTEGNVGVGLTTPTSKLSVDGDANITGVITASAFVGDGSGLTNVGGGNTADINSTTLVVSGIATISGLKYPSSDGSDGQVLTTDGAGNLTFQDPVSNTSTTTTSTSQTSVSSFSAATYSSAIYNVQITRGSDVHFTTLNLIHDGTIVSLLEYGTIRTGDSLASFDSDVSSGDVRILATPSSSSSTTFKFSRTLISSSGSNTNTATTTTTSSTQIDSFASGTYNSAKLEIEVIRGSLVQLSTLNLIHNGTDVYLTEYGILKTGETLANFDAVISGSNVVINSSATSSSTTNYKVRKTFVS